MCRSISMGCVALLAGTVVSQACVPLPKEVGEAVHNRLCPVGSIPLSELLGPNGGAGNVDPELRFMLDYLNLIQAGDLVSISVGQQRRLQTILKENDNLRNGLRSLVVKTVFEDRQLEKWCKWKDEGMPAADRDDEVGAIEEAVTCGPS